MSPSSLADLIFFIIVVIVVCWSLWKSAGTKARKLTAESWPTAEAAVQTFYVVHNNNDYPGDWTPYIPVLQYPYSVNGERYSGTFNLGVWESTQDSAQAAGKGWIGEKMRIRYKPADPAVSVWLEQMALPQG